jgi:hypothetical protein
MKGTSDDNSSSPGRRFGIEEMELRVGMAAVWSGEATDAFYRGREEGWRPVGWRWCSALKWSFREVEATGRAPVTRREEDEAAWLAWAARAVAAAVASREGGSGIAFRLLEEDENRVADRVGPPSSDRGRAGGCWAGRGRKRGGPWLGQKREEGRWAAVGPESRIRMGLPEKNRKGLWNFGCKIEFESR